MCGSASLRRRVGSGPHQGRRPGQGQGHGARRRGAVEVRADAFGTLSTRLSDVWAALKDEDDLSAENIKAPLKDIRRALLEADVSLPVVRRFIKNVEDKAVGIKVAHPGFRI